MSKKMLIDASHPEETRVVVVDGTRVEELDYESENKRQLRGNVYLARVTRVEPSLQAAFVEYGGNRHGFLAFSEIHPDYYQIPHEDRLALIEAEEAENLEEDKLEETTIEAKAKKDADIVSDVELVGENEIEDVIDLDDEDLSDNKLDDSSDEDDAPDPDDDADDGQDDDVADASEKEVEEEQEKMLGARKKRLSKRRYKIQEVIKRGQILLIQAVKEERGNKGAAMTTYLSLAGRYCVLMPNTPRGGGISRKISNSSDRKRLRTIMNDLSVPQGMGVIVRTAGAKRTKAEIKRDYDYLSRLWDTIRKKTLESIAPALIHEEGDLVKRSIRDLYGKDIEKVLVQGDEAYRVAKNFIKMLMPSHAKNVQPYKDEIPLFLRYQVEQQIESCLEPIAQLKSGGYLVIHPTEALVSVDVNSGRSTKERNVERTALKTNLEAAVEVARQMRLRDLAGLIVIDFIDMDENRNNRAVEKKMREALSKDRARVQMGRISQFGLMEISRQRRRRSLLEGSTASCEHCHGVGRKRSIESSALKAIHAIEEEGIRARAARIRLAVSLDVANYLVNDKRNILNSVDERFDMFTEVVANPDFIRPKLEITVLESKDNDGVDALEEIQKEHRKERSKEKKRRNTKSEPKEETRADTEEDTERPNNSPKKRRRGRRGARGRRKTANQKVEATVETPEMEKNAGTGDDTVKQKEAKAKSEDAQSKPKRSRKKTVAKTDKNDKKTKKDGNTSDTDTSNEDGPKVEGKQDEAETRSKTRKPRKPRTTKKKAETKDTTNADEAAQNDATQSNGTTDAHKKSDIISKNETKKTTRKPRRKPVKAKASEDSEKKDMNAPVKDKAPTKTEENVQKNVEKAEKDKPKRRTAAKSVKKNGVDSVSEPERVEKKPIENQTQEKPAIKKKGWWQKRNPFA